MTWKKEIVLNREFCDLIAYFIFGGDKPEITDWKSVFEEFKAQSLLPIAGTAKRINDFENAPQEILFPWKKIAEHCIGSYLQMRKTVRDLTVLLAESDTVPVILKGISAASYYPEPFYRPFGDVDFLVRGEKNADEVQDILVSHGFTAEEENSIEPKRHISLEKDGISYELHRYYSPGKTESDLALDRIISEAEPVRNADFHTFGDNISGLILLSHLSQHICGYGAGMRQAVDFMCYAAKILTDEYWKDTFEALTERVGLRKLAIHTVRMCELYLGFPHRKFAEEADDELCDLLIEELCAAGNFGTKRDGTDNKVKFYQTSGGFFRQLQRGGLSHWKAAREHKILRPFAWIYQSFRILKQLIVSLFKGKSGIKGIDQGKKVNYLIKNLDLR